MARRCGDYTQTQSLQGLQYLVEHAGQLVTKDALLHACWPGIAVGDGVLQVCMTELRKALGDTAAAPRFIATVHRRGYRFVAPVTQAVTQDTAQMAPHASIPAPLPPVSSPRRLAVQDSTEQKANGKSAQEAEACLHQALAVARGQQAKVWELRAALSLSRLWQRQGKRDAARQLLAEVHGWFTEGFETVDLQDARTLLHKLRPA